MFNPLRGFADELGVSYFDLVAVLRRRGLDPEAVAVEVGEPYGREVANVRALLVAGPDAETEEQGVPP